MGFFLTKTIQLLGYPHDYGTPHTIPLETDLPYGHRGCGWQTNLAEGEPKYPWWDLTLTKGTSEKTLEPEDSAKKKNMNFSQRNGLTLWLWPIKKKITSKRWRISPWKKMEDLLPCHVWHLGRYPTARALGNGGFSGDIAGYGGFQLVMEVPQSLDGLFHGKSH